MGWSIDPADFSTGLDLFLLGSIAYFIGYFIVNVSSVAVDSFTGMTGITFLQATAVIPDEVGMILGLVGGLVLIGGPLFFWVLWPIQQSRRNSREET